MPVDTIPALVRRNGERLARRPAYFVRGADTWKASTWAQYAGQVRRAGKALMALGVEPGQTVCILGFNRPEWTIMDLAAMSVGAVPAGVYTTSSPEEVQYILHHAEAPLVLLEDQNQWAKVDQRRDLLPHLRTVVMMQGASHIDDKLVLSWDAFMEMGEQIDDARFDERIDALEPDALATLIYTSGTTGPPKGVMLSNRNLAWTASQAARLFDLTSEDSSLSYLPLSHIAEQMFSIHSHAVTGGSIYFAESVDAVADNLREVRPTLFFGVPRVWEKFYAGVTAKLAEAHGAKARIASWATGIGSRMSEARNRGASASPPLAAQYALADRLVFSKVHEALGFGRLRLAVSGAAPLSKEIIDFFGGLDIRILEVYGQSEGSGPTTFNRPGYARFGSVGPPFPGCDVRIAPDGEILARGDNVFLGYYKDPAATKDTLGNGWLHSGDLGEFDDEGFLRITGRKKDIIITAGGKNIAPAVIEGLLKNHALISEAVVIGDRRRYLTALITLDTADLERFMTERGLEGDPDDVPAVRETVQAGVDAVNESLARVEQIKKFTILPRELSVAEGELTPTLKVKRRIVNSHFEDTIEKMYVD